MRFIFLLISIFIIPILTGFVGLQLIALADFIKKGFTSPFILEFNFYRYLEYRDYLNLVIFFILLLYTSLVWNLFFSKNSKEKHKTKHLTLQEKRNYSHLASVYEAKKGTQRFEFNRKGESKENRTIKGLLDVIFDKPKKLYNKLIVALKLSDVHKLNTITNYNIEGNESGRRSGIPIITKKNVVWVEAGDINSLIVGGTRSGKTYGIINIMIQLARMAKESVLIMDVKGELHIRHAQSFRDSGYDVKKIDFIFPKKSIKHNPLGVIIKKYRAAYNEWLMLMREDKYISIKKTLTTKTLVLHEIEAKLKKTRTSSELDHLRIKRKILQKEIEDIIENLPKPNYSKAKEYSLDIAMTLCMDESKDPFWPSSAATLLDGYINFLLEEKVYDANGNWSWLPDSMINMYSIKLLHDLGKTPLKKSEYDDCENVLQYYVKHYRNPDDASSMKLKAYLDAPDNTAGSISSVFDDKLKYYLANEDILAMTCESEFELTDLGKKKMAIFVSIHDEKSTFHPLASIIFSQLYEELIEEARDVAIKNDSAIQRLSRPVMVLWDEFANGARWDNITNALSAGLSRGIRYNLVIQDYTQLETLYGDKKSGTIKSNCLNTSFLLANDNKTLRDISERCGKGLKWDKNKNEKVSYDVVSTDRLNNLSMGEVVQIRARKNPYISRVLGFDSYCFAKNLPKTPFDKDRDFGNIPKFNILKAWKQRIDNDGRLQVEKESSRKSVVSKYKTMQQAKLNAQKTSSQSDDEFVQDNKTNTINDPIIQHKNNTRKARQKTMNEFASFNVQGLSYV